jgi:hypothetical protein
LEFFQNQSSGNSRGYKQVIAGMRVRIATGERHSFNLLVNRRPHGQLRSDQCRIDFDRYRAP